MQPQAVFTLVLQGTLQDRANSTLPVIYAVGPLSASGALQPHRDTQVQALETGALAFCSIWRALVMRRGSSCFL